MKEKIIILLIAVPIASVTGVCIGTFIPEERSVATEKVIIKSDTETVHVEVEYCADGLDNDKDGHIDCEDSDCEYMPQCLSADFYASLVSGRMPGETVCYSITIKRSCGPDRKLEICMKVPQDARLDYKVTESFGASVLDSP